MVVLESWPFATAGTDNDGNEPSEDRWTELAQYLTTDGVALYSSTDILGALSGNLEVSQNALLQVQVNSGRIFIRGHFGKLDPAILLPVTPNTSGNPRIDTVIARLNKGTGVKNIEIVVKAGTPAGSPVAPTLTRSSTIYEVAIANLAVANGASTILTADITDRRQFVTSRRKARRVFGRLANGTNGHVGEGIASSSQPGTGRFACVFTIPMLTVTYSIQATAQSEGGKYFCEVQNSLVTKTGFEVRVYDLAGNLSNPNWVHFTAEEVG